MTGVGKDQFMALSPGGIPENVLQFSTYLREKGIQVPFSAVIDVIGALRDIDIFDKQEFYALLQANFVCSRSERILFDSFFRVFWLGDTLKDSRSTRVNQGDKASRATEDTTIAALSRPNIHTASETGQDGKQSTYGILHHKKSVKPDLFSGCRELRAVLEQWLRPARQILSRRHRTAVNGRKISMGRMLRKNMQFGGELLLMAYMKKKVKKRRVVFLCDVSGSMERRSALLLCFAQAFAGIDPQTEIFFFSTRLKRMTRQFQAARHGTMNDLPQTVHSFFGGGTRIGRCFRKLNQDGSKRLISNKTILIIFSDGWDLGEIDLLKQQMQVLKRRCHRTIWLNPLARSTDYKPVCLGMAAALPYIDHFLPLDAARDLKCVIRLLKTMMV